MSRKPPLVAAGACVVRYPPAEAEPWVLLVHRPAYRDWTLPKGKPEPDEDLPVTAVREVLEETACLVRLGLPLGHETHVVGRGKKRVYWWRAEVISECARTPDDEVDKVEWFPQSKARKKLTYPADRAVLDRALAAPPTSVLAIVRHGKAMDRKNWSGHDWLRPLSARGRRQSKRLVHLLRSYGIERVTSSSATRCEQTVAPYAKAAELPLELIEALSEECFDRNPEAVSEVMRELARDAASGRGVATCGHRPVLPQMRAAIKASAAPMLTAEVQVVHLNAEAAIVAIENHKSRF